MTAGSGYAAATDNFYGLAQRENEPKISFPIFIVATKDLLYSLLYVLITNEIKKPERSRTVKNSQ